MKRPSVVIVSPALAAANNGNWQTARRWQKLLSPQFRARISQHWADDAAGSQDELMIALHARRSAAAIQAWAQARGKRQLAVVLTGTDLYQDILHDTAAQRSLQLAGRLVVLQELGVAALPAEHRPKARVIYQSTSARQSLSKSARRLRAVMVGHMRDVKSPQTLFDAARLLATRSDILIDHIGAGAGIWAERARATERDCPHYRWLGELPHGKVRRAIQRAHVLVHTSALEGGAHVVMEAVRSGTPVLASRVAGNLGMLGADYEGYFEHGQAGELAALLERCSAELRCRADGPAPSLLQRLGAQCSLRATLFTPEAERAALLDLLHEMQDFR
jgi:putative glycosyltransferase (TIGR04348 family)